MPPEADASGAGEGAGNNPPASPPAPGAGKGKSDDSAADVAGKGKTRREIDLEKKVSEQEDTIHTLKGRLDDVEKFVNATKGKPGTPSKKSFWDEVTEFVCPDAQAPADGKPATGN